MTGKVETKRARVVGHDGLVFALGWHRNEGG